MRLRALPSALAAGACLLCAATARPAETVLEANFDDKTVGSPIGTGGAVAGEPVSVTGTISAIVREFPLETPNLKVNDVDLLAEGFVRFEFLNQWVIDHGTLTISADIWFQAYEDYAIRVRERRTRSKKFLDLVFGSTGGVRYSDENSPVLTPLGTYEIGRLIPLRIAFDLDAGTYDVVFDGVPLLVGETHGITPYGIGALLFGHLVDEDVSGEFSLDNLLVTATEVPTATPPASWGDTKAAYR